MSIYDRGNDDFGNDLFFVEEKTEIKQGGFQPMIDFKNKIGFEPCMTHFKWAPKLMAVGSKFSYGILETGELLTWPTKSTAAGAGFDIDLKAVAAERDGIIGKTANLLNFSKDRGESKKPVFTGIYTCPTGDFCLFTTNDTENFVFIQKTKTIESISNRLKKPVTITALKVIDSKSEEDKAALKFVYTSTIGSFGTATIDFRYKSKDKTTVLHNMDVNSEELSQNKHNSVIHKIDIEKFGDWTIVFLTASNGLFMMKGKESPQRILAKELDKERKNYMVLNCFDRDSIFSIHRHKGQIHSILFSDMQKIFYFKFPKSVTLSLTQIDNLDAKGMKMEPLCYYRRDQKMGGGAMWTISEFDQVNHIFLSEFHYYIVRPDCISIINLISQKLVEHKLYPEEAENVNFCVSEFKQMIFNLPKLNLFYKFEIEVEGNDSWNLYLEKNDLESAYELSKRFRPEFSHQIASLLAKQLFDNKRYKEASELYSQIDVPFERTVLMFLEKVEEDIDAQYGFLSEL